MKTLMIVAAALLAAVTGGCVVHSHGPAHRHHVYGPAVVVGAGHVHSDHCGHYRHGDYWYHSHNHRHGHGCGHVYRGGFWVVVD